MACALKGLFLLSCLQMKTVSVALVLCLNVGVDPPDVVKTTPCARLECWIGKSRGSPRRARGLARVLPLVCGNLKPSCLHKLSDLDVVWVQSPKIYGGESLSRKTSKSMVVGFYNFLLSICPAPGT